MIKVAIKCDEGVCTPLYESEKNISFDIRAKSFKKLFKGNQEVLLGNKLQQSISEGYLTLRGFERVLVGTGLHIEMPIGYELQLTDFKANILKRGLSVAPISIGSDYNGELNVILINNTPFLSRIILGDIVAQGVSRRIQHIMWDIKK